MESRLILPSNNYPSPRSDSQTRLPLSDAAGNSQVHALASLSQYSDSKGFHPRVDFSFSIPTVPSQPASQTNQQSLAISSTALSARRQTIRRAQSQRYTPAARGRNPILDSPQYRAYRQRQCREGNDADAKWPVELEDAFLDGSYNLQLSILH